MLQQPEGQGQGGVLPTAERFLLLMASVPRLRPRLECFSCKLNFDSWLQVMDGPASSVAESRFSLLNVRLSARFHIATTVLTSPPPPVSA